MPFCSECKREYASDCEICEKCGKPLTNNPDENANDMEDTVDNRDKLLTEVADDMEAEIIISKLRSYGIPAMVKHKGITQGVSAVMGSSLFGRTSIYVPASAADTARKLLWEDPEQEGGTAADTDTGEVSENDGPAPEAEPTLKDEKKWNAVTTVLIVIVGIILIYLFSKLF